METTNQRLIAFFKEFYKEDRKPWTCECKTGLCTGCLEARQLRSKYPWCQCTSQACCYWCRSTEDLLTMRRYMSEGCRCDELVDCKVCVEQQPQLARKPLGVVHCTSKCKGCGRCPLKTIHAIQRPGCICETECLCDDFRIRQAQLHDRRQKNKSCACTVYANCYLCEPPKDYDDIIWEAKQRLEQYNTERRQRGAKKKEMVLNEKSFPQLTPGGTVTKQYETVWKEKQKVQTKKKVEEQEDDFPPLPTEPKYVVKKKTPLQQDLKMTEGGFGVKRGKKEQQKVETFGLDIVKKAEIETKTIYADQITNGYADKNAVVHTALYQQLQPDQRTIIDMYIGEFGMPFCITNLIAKSQKMAIAQGRQFVVLKYKQTSALYKKLMDEMYTQISQRVAKTKFLKDIDQLSQMDRQLKYCIPMNKKDVEKRWAKEKETLEARKQAMKISKMIDECQEEDDVEDSDGEQMTQEPPLPSTVDRVQLIKSTDQGQTESDDDDGKQEHDSEEIDEQESGEDNDQINQAEHQDDQSAKTNQNDDNSEKSGRSSKKSRDRVSCRNKRKQTTTDKYQSIMEKFKQGKWTMDSLFYVLRTKLSLEKSQKVYSLLTQESDDIISGIVASGIWDYVDLIYQQEKQGSKQVGYKTEIKIRNIDQIIKKATKMAVMTPPFTVKQLGNRKVYDLITLFKRQSELDYSKYKECDLLQIGRGAIIDSWTTRMTTLGARQQWSMEKAIMEEGNNSPKLHSAMSLMIGITLQEAKTMAVQWDLCKYALTGTLAHQLTQIATIRSRCAAMQQSIAACIKEQQVTPIPIDKVGIHKFVKENRLASAAEKRSKITSSLRPELGAMVEMYQESYQPQDMCKLLSPNKKLEEEAFQVTRLASRVASRQYMMVLLVEQCLMNNQAQKDVSQWIKNHYGRVRIQNLAAMVQVSTQYRLKNQCLQSTGVKTTTQKAGAYVLDTRAPAGFFGQQLEIKNGKITNNTAKEAKREAKMAKRTSDQAENITQLIEDFPQKQDGQDVFYVMVGDQQLKSVSYVGVVGDGNCLFRAVSLDQGLFAEVDIAQLLRIKSLRINWSLTQRSKWGRRFQHAGSEMINQLRSVVKKNICLVSKETGAIELHLYRGHNSVSGRNTVFLCHYSGHFDAVSRGSGDVRKILNIIGAQMHSALAIEYDALPENTQKYYCVDSRGAPEVVEMDGNDLREAAYGTRDGRMGNGVGGGRPFQVPRTTAENEIAFQWEEIVTLPAIYQMDPRHAEEFQVPVRVRRGHLFLNTAGPQIMSYPPQPVQKQDRKLGQQKIIKQEMRPQFAPRSKVQRRKNPNTNNNFPLHRRQVISRDEKYITKTENDEETIMSINECLIALKKIRLEANKRREKDEAATLLIHLLKQGELTSNEFIKEMLGAGKNPLDLYYRLRKDTTLLEQGKQKFKAYRKKDLNDHTRLAEGRRVAIMYQLIMQNEYDTIMFIGGHIKREWVVRQDKTVIYVNPALSWKDEQNNRDIREYIESTDRCCGNVWEREAQTLSLMDQCACGDWCIRKPKLVVLVNSHYYAGDLGTVMQPGDKILAIGHVFDNTSTSASHPGLVQTTELDVNEYYIKMRMNGTNDHYAHTNRSLLKYDKIVLGRHRLTYTVEERTLAHDNNGTEYAAFRVTAGWGPDDFTPRQSTNMNAVADYRKIDFAEKKILDRQGRKVWLQNVMHTQTRQIITPNQQLVALNAPRLNGKISRIEQNSMGHQVDDKLAIEYADYGDYDVPLIYESLQRTIISSPRFEVQLTAGLLQFRYRWYSFDMNRAMYEQAGMALKLCTTEQEKIDNIKYYYQWLAPHIRGQLAAQVALMQSLKPDKQFKFVRIVDMNTIADLNGGRILGIEQSPAIGRYSTVAQRVGVRVRNFFENVADAVNIVNGPCGNNQQIFYHGPALRGYTDNTHRITTEYTLIKKQLAKDIEDEQITIWIKAIIDGSQYVEWVYPKPLAVKIVEYDLINGTIDVKKIDESNLDQRLNWQVNTLMREHEQLADVQFDEAQLGSMCQSSQTMKKYFKSMFGQYSPVRDYRKGRQWQVEALTPQAFYRRELVEVFEDGRHKITITNSVHEAMMWLLVNKELLDHVGFDVEAYDGHVCSIQITANYQDEYYTLVYHGRQVYLGQFMVYALFTTIGTTIYVWDANVDGVYEENIIDMQQQPYFVYPGSAKISLAAMAERQGIKEGKLAYNGYHAFNMETISDSTALYAARDSYICNRLMNKMRQGAKQELDVPVRIQIGSNQINISLELADKLGFQDGNKIEWCRNGNNQLVSMHSVMREVHEHTPWIVGFIDVGQGRQSDCAAQVMLSHITRPYMLNYTKDPLQHLKERNVKGLELLQPGIYGVTIESLVKACSKNGIDYTIYSTQTGKPVMCKSQRKPTRDGLVVLSHAGHAWIGVTQFESNMFKTPYTKTPQDCHCGACVLLSVHHNKQCRTCIATGETNSNRKRYDPEILKTAKTIISASRMAWMNQEAVKALDNVLLRPKDVPEDFEERSQENMHKYLKENKEERLAGIIEDEKNTILTSRCLGTCDIQLNHDQKLLRYQPEECSGHSNSYRQCGPIFKNYYYESQCGCASQQAYAMIQRTAKSKGVCTDLRRAFVDFTKEYDNHVFERDQDCNINKEQVFQEAYDNLMESNKKARTKARIAGKLDQAFHDSRQLTTYTDGFIKKEITFSEAWPRLISARQEEVRQISSMPYKYVAKQLYKCKRMIKGVDDDEMVQRVIDSVADFEYVQCYDKGSFDSSQRGPIWEIEENLFEIITGPEGAELWRAAALNANRIVTNSAEIITSTTRNSGEQSTSSTNTHISDRALCFATYLAGLRPKASLLDDREVLWWNVLDQRRREAGMLDEGKHTGWSIEGDDDGSGSDRESFRKMVKLVYESIGFDTKIEHEGGIDGASFCKIQLRQLSDGSVIGFRRLDHILAKLGWTKNHISHRQSQTSRNYMYTKTLSMMVMFKHSKKMQELGNTIIERLGYVKKLNDDQHIRPTMTKTDWVDEHYGQDLDKMIHNIREHGLYTQLDARDYPTIFDTDRQHDRKNTDYKFVDLGLAQHGYTYVRGIQKQDAMSLQQALERAQNWTELESVKGFIAHPLKSDMIIPVYVLKGVGEIQVVSTLLKEFASKGIVLHLNSDFYMTLKRMKGIQQARQLLKPITTHNDKLGFDWSVPNKNFMENVTDQFKVSKYKQFIEQAIQFLQPDQQFAKYVNHLRAMSQKFTLDVRQNFNNLNPDGIGYDDEQDRRVGRNKDAQYRLDDDLKYAQEVEQASKGYLKVDPRHVYGTMKALPAIMDHLAREIEGDYDQKYINSIINPFSEDAQGIRVPSLNPEKTLATYDMQTTSFTPSGKTLIVINYTANETSPYLYVTGLVNDFSTAPALIQSLVVPHGLQADETTYKNVVGYATGLDYGTFMANSKVGTALENRRQYESQRIVAAGFRLWKTSRADSESGVIKMYYGSRGATITKSLKNLTDDVSLRKDAAKVYVAAGSGQCGGRAGFMCGGIYKPKESGEVEDFHQSSNIFLQEQQLEFLTAAEQANSQLSNFARYPSYYGPLSYYAKSDPGAGDATATFIENMSTVQASEDTNIMISAADLSRKHVVIITMEDIAAGTSFELEVIRRVEGIPTDEAQSYETKEALLGDEYTSPLDIIRKLSYSGVQRPPLYWYMSEEGIYMQGIWDWPVFQTIKDVAKMGLDAITKNKNVRDLLVEAAPNLANIILSKIPGLDMVSQPITNAVRDITKQMLKIDDMQGINDEEETIQLLYNIVKNANEQQQQQQQQQLLDWRKIEEENKCCDEYADSRQQQINSRTVSRKNCQPSDYIVQRWQRKNWSNEDYQVDQPRFNMRDKKRNQALMYGQSASSSKQIF